MKTTKLMAIAACALACAAATADTVKPAAPVNPKPGMIFSAYGAYTWMTDNKNDKIQAGLKECFSFLPKLPAVKTGVDKSEKFTIDCAKGVATAAIRWEGFLPCNADRTYTFLVQKNTTRSRYENWQCGYAVAINGKVCCAAFGQTSFDVDLKNGFNKVEIVTLLPDGYGFEEVRNSPLLLFAKRKESLKEPMKLDPGMFFYDEPVDDEEDDFKPKTLPKTS